MAHSPKRPSETAGRAMLQMFQRIYVINLAHRTDRRREMEAELRRIGLEPDITEVIWFDAIRPAEQGEFPTIGTRGCFESHLAVLRLIAQGPAEAGLILEDDADFSPGLEIGLDLLRGEAWDLFSGIYTGNDASPRRLPSGLILVRPEDGLLTTHFLAVKRETAQQLVPYLEAIARRPRGDPKGGPMHVDGAYTWFRRANPELRTLCPSQPISYQRPSRTDIHAPGVADRSNFLKSFMTALRRLKRSWNRFRR